MDCFYFKSWHFLKISKGNKEEKKYIIEFLKLFLDISKISMVTLDEVSLYPWD